MGDNNFRLSAEDRGEHLTPKELADYLDEYLTPKEAAAFYNCSERCFENWRNRGGGPPYVRFGHRMIRYRRGGLIDHASDRTFTSTAEESPRA